MDELSVNMDTAPNVEQSECLKSSFSEEKEVQPQRNKRKHRRGKPRPKNERKAFKNVNWKFQAPRFKYRNRVSDATGSGGGGGGGGGGNGANNRGSAPKSRQRSRPKMIRSNSLAPYNTNKFLMEEHMVEVPTLTPTGRTRESSFSVDSEDNYFFSLPEDEEDFLTKEFSNVYEDARVERLENLSKQELIQECLEIEDRYASDEGKREQLNVQRITAEFTSRIRSLEQKLKELTRENYNLRCQLMRTTAAAAASPPSAAAPTCAAAAPIFTTSEDTESDSSSSSTSSSSSSNRDEPQSPRRRSFSSSNSNLGENQDARDHFQAMEAELSSDRDQLVGIPMEDDTNDGEKSNEPYVPNKETASSKTSSPVDLISLQNESNQSNENVKNES